MKNDKFLDFLYSRIRHTSQKERILLSKIPTDPRNNHGCNGHHDCANDYPYVSLCGGEINYIRPADSAIVFHTLTTDGRLVFGGNLSQPFRPTLLAISPMTGRIYHRLVAPERVTPLHNEMEGPMYGLVRSAIAVSLSDKLSLSDDGMVYTEEGETCTVGWLPKEAEPGPWAVPVLDDEAL